MVFVLKCECAIRVNATREVWIAAGNQDQITVERTVRANRASTIHPCVKTKVRTQQRQRSSFREQLSRRAGRKKLIGVNAIDWLARIKRIKLDAEHRMAKLRAIHDALNSLPHCRGLRY